MVDWYTVGTLVAITILVIGGFISKIIQKLSKEKVIKTDLSKENQRNIRIHGYLTELRVNANADRAFMFKFHNGEYYLDNISVIKASVTHEAVKDGISHTLYSSQNIPISSISEVIEMIVDNDLEVYYIKDLPRSLMRSRLQSFNVNCFAYYPLHKGMQIVGFIGIDYCNSSEPADAEDALRKLEHCANLVEVVMAN